MVIEFVINVPIFFQVFLSSLVLIAVMAHVVYGDVDISPRIK